MGTSRKGKVVATEYFMCGVFITQMGDNRWSIYTGPNGSGVEIANSYRTLKDARSHAPERVRQYLVSMPSQRIVNGIMSFINDHDSHSGTIIDYIVRGPNSNRK